MAHNQGNKGSHPPTVSYSQHISSMNVIKQKDSKGVLSPKEGGGGEDIIRTRIKREGIVNYAPKSVQRTP